MKFRYILALCAGTASPGVCHADDYDFVSDLNGSGDATVHVNENDVSANGRDAVDVNKSAPREPAAKPAQVGKQVDDAPPAAKAPTLRDQISSALKGEEATPAVAVQDGRVRNPDGTFAPKVAAEAAPAPEPAAGTPAVAIPAGIAPEVFQSLPAETQAQLARTMDDVAQNQQRFARLGEVEQVLSARRDAWAMNGMTEAQAVNQLLALSDFATRDGPGFIRWFTENNGINLEDLVFDAEPVDPKYASLEQKITHLEQQRQQETQQQQQAAHQRNMDSVVAFASEKGPEGQPLRPYFEELGNDVLPFISAVVAQNPNWSHTQVLQEAYDRACWGTPSVRAKMQAATEAAREAERLRAGAAKADAARAASVSVRSGTPTSAPAAPDHPGRNLRDTIRASMAAHS